MAGTVAAGWEIGGFLSNVELRGGVWGGAIIVGELSVGELSVGELGGGELGDGDLSRGVWFIDSGHPAEG
jgi:hypothetical protein